MDVIALLFRERRCLKRLGDLAHFGLKPDQPLHPQMTIDTNRRRRWDRGGCEAEQEEAGGAWGEGGVRFSRGRCPGSSTVGAQAARCDAILSSVESGGVEWLTEIAAVWVDSVR